MLPEQCRGSVIVGWLLHGEGAHVVALTAEATSFTPLVMQYRSAQPASFGALRSPPMIKVEINGGDIMSPDADPVMSAKFELFWGGMYRDPVTILGCNL
jgi:hypothetical protein